MVPEPLSCLLYVAAGSGTAVAGALNPSIAGTCRLEGRERAALLRLQRQQLESARTTSEEPRKTR